MDPDFSGRRGRLTRSCEQLAKELGPTFAERVAKLRGRNRPYFSVSGTELREPLQIPDAGLYVEGNLNSHSIEQIARCVLHIVRGSDRGFRIEFVGQVAPATGSTPPKREAAPTKIAKWAERHHIVYSPRLEKNIGFANVVTELADPGNGLEGESSTGLRWAVPVPTLFVETRKVISRALLQKSA